MKKSSRAQSLLTVLLSLALVHCARKELNPSQNETLGLSVDPAEASLESGLSSLQGLVDEQSGGGFALNNRYLRSRGSEFLVELLISKAHASNCQRAIFQSCNSSVKTANYSQCSVPGTSFTMNGTVDLTYSDSTCALSSNGETVTRNYSLSYSGPRGGQLSISSANGSDYLGNTYGGGGRITKTSSGWSLEVLGKHKSFSWRGQTIYSVSMRTTTPHSIAGALTRAGRNIDGGVLEIHHNLAKFKVDLTPQNLSWSNSCCHPVAGSIGLVYSGSKTGTSTVSFSGQCGIANIIENGQTRQVQLSYCE